jgi:TonB-dependent receptor
VTVSGIEATLKFGAKTSRRTKTHAQTTWVVGDLGDPPLSLSDADRGLGNFASGQIDHPFGTFGPRIASGPLLGLLGRLNLDDFVDDEESAINDLRMRERIDAAYLMSTFQLGETTVIAGLRGERTTLRASGTGIEDGEFVTVDTGRRQTHWLPGLHLRHDLDRSTSVRAALTKSVVRPTFEQLSPGFVIDGNEAEFGNPQLAALRSTNFDLGFERQLGYAGAVSVYAFAKRIQNFVYQTDVAGSGRWADFDEAITFANGDKASVRGVEFAWSRAWRDLPGFWGGLVTSANATWSTSEARIGANDDGRFVARTVPLPSQSDRAFNAVIGWESPAFGVRLAANHKSRYLLEVGDPLDAERDLYVDAQTQWDLSARFALGTRSTLVVEALNLGNEPYYVFQARPSRNAQSETYGRTLRVGLKMALF